MGLLDTIAKDVGGVGLMLVGLMAPLGAAGGAAIAVAVEGESGCVMMGRYEGGAFVADVTRDGPDPARHSPDFRRSLARFKQGDSLRGVGLSGRGQTAKVGATRVPLDLGLFSIDLQREEGAQGEVAMFTNPELKIRVLKPRRDSKLPVGIDRQLRARLDELWRTHLLERRLEERPAGYEVTSTIVESLSEAPGLLAVQYALDLAYVDGKDSGRANAFFLYWLRDGRILRGTFGHGEWSNGSTVLTIRPEIYFRIAGDSKIYFLGEHMGGWEDAYGRAIFDLGSGATLLTCY